MQQDDLPIVNLSYRTIMEAFNAYVTEEKPALESPKDVAETMLPVLSRCEQEEFWVLHLNTKNRLVAAEQVTKGLADRSQVHAREVFREAIRRNVSRLILVHGHPSGDPTPSTQDISCTKSLIQAGKIIGIEVLDHVVTGRRTSSRHSPWVSLKEENLM